ncbi:MAG: alpha/beta hydrolase [Sphingomonadales bacterium]|jgi:pimeloyl-ACP methyl ester carboxylesterase|nr:alpha/beta hydrolase [Sphingomonadales bacterium]MBK9004238.1 alpha/beta hydrolase [Sphingomonadales bacterium]MBK9269415.1 alpha/beta hydrolase [Sphingomonadales bacterium]MBP6433797.1 alpha/beta hydrolase [Sphingorhabdus sp.]
MVRKFLLTLAIFLIATTAILFFGQRFFFYPAPQMVMAEPPPGYRFVQTQTSDGLKLRSAYTPAKEGKPTLLFFHGNGDSIAGAHAATRLLVDQGYGALLVEYRGYGGNPGAPGEEGFYRDGETAVEWLSGQGIKANELVIVGNSIGSGPATEMALRHDPAALVLISGFASLPFVVSDIRPFIPRQIVRDRYDNEAKVGRIKAPILILQGEVDRLVRPINAARLAQAAPDATLKIVPDAGHELAYGQASQRMTLDWLDKNVIR